MIDLKERAIRFARQQAKRLLAVSIIVGIFLFAQLPILSTTERSAIAERFSFTRVPLPQLMAGETKQERAVNPHLARHSGWISAVGAAIALNDLDGDGLPNDLCQVETRTDQIIVAPVPGSGERYQPFTLATPQGADVAGTIAPMGCVPHDMNEDGQMDLLVYYWGRTPVAYLKQTDALLGQDSYLVQSIGPDSPVEEWFTNAATFADVDGDGHSDLILGNYFADHSEILNPKATNTPQMQDSMTRAYNGGMNHIFRWTRVDAADYPTVSFTDMEDVFEPEIAHAWTLAIGAADLDGDMLPELYFANDFGPDRLLHNRSHAGDVKLAILAGQKPIGMPSSKVLGNDGFKGMGVDFADLNNDGLLDIYVSNIADQYALEESHFVFISTGQLDKMQQGIAPYLDHSESLGLARSSWGWETKFGDFDNDGVTEALQATGFRKGQVNRWPELQELAIANDGAVRHAGSWFAFHPGDDLSGHDPNGFFVRADDGRFYDVSTELGLDDPFVTRGIATADVDGDGDLDYAIANQWEESYFYRNDSPNSGEFLGLRLQHPSGSPVIGAVANVVTPDGQSHMAQVDGGNGHSGARSSDLHFGLGDLPDGAELPVHLQWRDRSGDVHQADVRVSPGWHTVELGQTAKRLASKSKLGS
jgi:enediyne biosynthesis protein E4